MKGRCICGLLLKAGVSVVVFGRRLVYLYSVWLKTSICMYELLWKLLEGWAICLVSGGRLVCLGCCGRLGYLCLVEDWCVCDVLWKVGVSM